MDINKMLAELRDILRPVPAPRRAAPRPPRMNGVHDAHCFTSETFIVIAQGEGPPAQVQDGRLGTDMVT